MSVWATLCAWEVKAMPTAKLVLLAIADRAFEEGPNTKNTDDFVWPKPRWNRIAIECNLSPEKLEYEVHKLQKAGVLAPFDPDRIVRYGCDGLLVRFYKLPQLDLPRPWREGPSDE